MSFFVQQGWQLWSDWPKIEEFVANHKANEYTFDRKREYIDHTIFDPNDQLMQTKDKWRCVKRNFWYQINKNGVVVNSEGDYLTFATERECARNLFLYNIKTRTYKDPCPRAHELCDLIIAI